MLEEQEVVLTKRNHKLLNIAKICEIAAWVVLVGYVFISFDTYHIKKLFLQPNQLTDSSLSSVYENVYPYFDMVVDIADVIFQGITGFLILYGVSYGLKMLVETDVNYRLNAGEKTTPDNERDLVINKIHQHETDALVKQWLNHDENKWSPMEFEVMGGILIERLGELPTDEYPFDEPVPSAQSKRNPLQELKGLLSDNDPVFYDPKILETFIRWLNRVLYLLIPLNIIQNILGFWPYLMSFEEYKRSGNPWFDIGYALCVLTLSILILFFEFKTMALVLKILKEMEFNSRKKG